jgi:hypothetical protein
MPASDRSLLITDAYRARLALLADRVSTLTLQRWTQNVTLTRLDDSHALWLTATVAAVEQAQRAGINLTAAYLAAFIGSETGQRATELPTIHADRFAGVAEDGQPLEVPLSKTLIGVKAALKDGKAPAEALQEQAARALRLSSSAVMSAPRAALADQIATHPQITGWKRVTSGGCGACLAAAAHGYSAHEHLKVHPHCHCTQEPVIRDVADTAKRPSGPEVFAAMSRKEQDMSLGPDTAQLMREGRVTWGELIASNPMVVGPDVITQAPFAALT